ncbi:MAG: zinc ribbon domain-containing protein [Clostridia bacterium]|nr:zinc ribbon domain-containing protein [Clostridia bacterium]
MFCRFCGNEVHDEAYICPSCGRQIKAFPNDFAEEPVQPAELAPIEQPTPPKGKATVKRLSRVFGTLGIVFNALGFAFMLATLLGWIMLMVGEAQVDYYASEPYFVIGTLFLMYGGIFGLIFTAFATEFATAAFVLGLIQKEDRTLKRRSIGVFVASMVIMALFIFVFFYGAVFFSLVVPTEPVYY